MVLKLKELLQGKGQGGTNPQSCSPAAYGPSVQACISIITDVAGSPARLHETAQSLSGKSALPSPSEEAQGSFPCASKPGWQVLCTVNGPTPCGFCGSAKYHGLCLQSLPIPTQAGSQFPCGPLLLFHLPWLRPGKFRSAGCFYGVKKHFIFHYSLAQKPKA